MFFKSNSILVIFYTSYANLARTIHGDACIEFVYDLLQIHIRMRLDITVFTKYKKSKLHIPLVGDHAITLLSYLMFNIQFSRLQGFDLIVKNQTFKIR